MDRPRYQFMPPLLPDEYEALKASIADRGVEVPVIVDQDGETVDGFHREKATDELGVFCPKEVRQFENEADKFELALRLNCRRRQLNREQKRDLIAAYLQRDPQIADNCLAEIIGGVSKNTVAEIRAQLESTCLIDKFPTLRGKDGKERPKKYRRIIASSPKEVETALHVIADLPDNLRGAVDVITAKRRANRIRNKRLYSRSVTAPSLTDDDFKLSCCRFQDLEVEPSSINLIATDIPYGDAFLPQLPELAEFAFRVLVDGGVFVSYVGKHHLDSFMRELGRTLSWGWMGAVLFEGRDWHQCRNVVVRWRPVLIFYKKFWRNIHGRWEDLVQGKGKDKNWHPWQQALGDVQHWVMTFSKPNDLVCDPCAGSFTTAVACQRLQRRFVGCDVDQHCVDVGLTRLVEERDNGSGAA